MRKCYVRTGSADDVAVHLRDAEAPEMVVLPAAGEPPWVGVAAADESALDGVASELAARFGQVLLVDADDKGWSLDVLADDRPPLKIASTAVGKDDARKTAQAVSHALASPRYTTALARILGKPLNGAAALERVGDALGLVACGRPYDDIRADGRLQHLRVSGGRVEGKFEGAAAGPGHRHVSTLIEDTVVELLGRQRYAAALTQLRAYDIVLSAQDGALRCQAPSGMVTDGLRAAIGAHKEGLLQQLG